jgi:hypothetical protein
VALRLSREASYSKIKYLSLDFKSFVKCFTLFMAITIILLKIDPSFLILKLMI